MFDAKCGYIWIGTVILEKKKKIETVHGLEMTDGKRYITADRRTEAAQIWII